MILSASLRSRHRLSMDLSTRKVPEIPLLGRYNYIRAGLALPEHAHGNIVEICFLVKGRQTYRVNGRDYHLKGGDIFITFPNERHSSAGNPEEKGVLYWMWVRKTPRGFFGLSPDQSRVLWSSLCGLGSRHFRGSPKMLVHLNTITALFHGRDFSLRPASMSSETLAFLLEVLNCAGSREKPKHAAQNLGPVFAYIRDHLEETLSVPDLAGQTGLSTARFKARFKEETGVPPKEYVLRVKIDEARKRLAAGRESVTDIAYSLGFSSSQYFATVFKRFTGQTPGAWSSHPFPPHSPPNGKR